MGWFRPGVVGLPSLMTENFLGPMTVSFRGIKAAEIPCTNAIPPTGYFASTNFPGPYVHVYPNAGWAHRIREDNYFMLDRAGHERSAYANWSAGRLEWMIPIGWKRIITDNDDSAGADDVDYEIDGNVNSRKLLIGGREDKYKQVFIIEEDGTSKVEKFGFRMSRSRYDWGGSVEIIQKGEE